MAAAFRETSVSGSGTEVRELAAAIRDALDVPIADSRDVNNSQAEERLRSTRAALVQGVLGNFLNVGDASARDVAVTARTIRKVTAETPVTYTVSRSARAAS